MSWMQKLKRLTAASLRLKTLNDNPYIMYYINPNEIISSLVTPLMDTSKWARSISWRFP